MKLCNFTDVPATVAEPGAAEGVQVRWLIDDKSGAPNFAMRHFEIAPGGYTPKHSHDWEHEVFILTGEGVVWGNARENPLRPGDVIFLPSCEEHQFRNTGDEPLTMLCMIPLSQ